MNPDIPANPVRKGEYVVWVRVTRGATYLNPPRREPDRTTYHIARVTSATRVGFVKSVDVGDGLKNEIHPSECMTLSPKYQPIAATLVGRTFDDQESLKNALRAL